MFDLNNNILNWKQNLKFNDSFTNDNIEELENHLAEQIDYLRKSGLNDEEAFWVAQKRIGTINSLKYEFEKVNYIESVRKKVTWLMIGAVLIGFISHSIYIANSASYALGILMDINLVTWTYLVYSIQIIFIIALFLFTGWLFTDMSLRFSDFVSNNLIKISKRNLIKYFSIFGIIYNFFILFMWKYGLQWINVWQRNYASSEIYREHLETSRFLSVVSWAVSSFMILLILLYAVKKTNRVESLKA